VTGTDLRRRQAELVRALSRGAGAVRLADAAAGHESVALEAAVRDLEAAGLAELGADGLLRAGPRGSLLREEDVAAALDTRTLGRRLEIRAHVGSTNDVALEWARAGAAAGLVVAAELQTAGRGRRGRAFDSRPGLGLWSTSLLDTPARPEDAPRLSLVAALAVAATAERVAGVRCALKWPNDVQVDGRKICGVLVEARSVGGTLHPVAGIGVNVHHRAEDFPEEVRSQAASLESAGGTRVERSRVLAELLNELEALLQEEREGRLRLAERFASRDTLLDRAVEVIANPDGSGERRHGTARGVDERGRLRLETPTGTTLLHSGDVTVRPA